MVLREIIGNASLAAIFHGTISPESRRESLVRITGRRMGKLSINLAKKAIKQRRIYRSNLRGMPRLWRVALDNHIKFYQPEPVPATDQNRSVNHDRNRFSPDWPDP
jgi:hypothetical protein